VVVFSLWRKYNISKGEIMPGERENIEVLALEELIDRVMSHTKKEIREYLFNFRERVILSMLEDLN